MNHFFALKKDQYNAYIPYAKKINSCVRRRTERFKLIVDDAKSNGFLSSPVEMTTINLNFYGDEKMKPFKMLVSFMSTAVFVVMLGCASTAKHEGTGEYLDDSVITTKVKAAVFNEPTLKSAEINVETYKGVVQLSGVVRSEADIAKAASVASDVKGVTSVKNDMRLKAK